ncbi:MAG: DUF4860 domain-containing protein [Oscillibacter sp.]|nr:DUF4860 domain-containing protein [Oscillibacter sp.]
MRRMGGAGAVAAMALACVFGTALLLAMTAGAGVYRHVGERIARNTEERVSLTYVTAKLHAADEAGDVEVSPFGGADAVRLLRDADGVPYETILYVYGGALRELFCERDWEPAPETGQIIAEAQELRIREDAPGLLRLDYIGADGHASAAYVFLRSAGGGES